MSAITERSFTHGCSLSVKNPRVGQFINTGSYAGIRLNGLQRNSLFCSVPAPNPIRGWQIEQVEIDYKIKCSRGTNRGDLGNIVGVELRDGRRLVHRFDNPDFLGDNEWRIKHLYLPASSINIYDSGLAVTIHASNRLVPTEFLFSSIGLIFSQTQDGLLSSIPAEGPVKKSKKSKKR